jgi:hypothetical protein
MTSFFNRKDYISYGYEEELGITITGSLLPIGFFIDFSIGFPVNFPIGFPINFPIDFPIDFR